MINFLKKNFVLVAAILLGAVLVVKVIAITLGMSNFGWPTLNYFIGYETGFGGRKLIGTLSHLFLPEHLSLSIIRSIIISANIILILLLFLFYARVTKSTDRNIVALIILLYFASPFSLVEWFQSGCSVVFMETYQLIIVTIWLLLYLKYSSNYWMYAVTAITVIICCLIHHTFCCTLLPLMASLLVYDMFCSDKLIRTRFLLTGLICVALGILLFFIWTHSEMNIPQDKLTEYIHNSTNIRIKDESTAIQQLYYDSNFENYANQRESLIQLRYPEFAISILLLSPMLLILYFPLFHAISNSNMSVQKCRYLLIGIIMIIMPLPIFVVATDYTRWFVCSFFCLSSLDLVLIYKNDALVTEGFYKLKNFFKKRIWLLIILIIYMLNLHNISFLGLKEAIEAWSLVSSSILNL